MPKSEVFWDLVFWVLGFYIVGVWVFLWCTLIHHHISGTYQVQIFEQKSTSVTMVYVLTPFPIYFTPLL